MECSVTQELWGVTVFRIKQASRLEGEGKVINSPLRCEWRGLIWFQELLRFKRRELSRAERMFPKLDIEREMSGMEMLSQEIVRRLSRERRGQQLEKCGGRGAHKQRNGGSYFRWTLWVPTAANLPPRGQVTLTWTSQLIVLRPFTKWCRIVLTPFWIQLTTQTCHVFVVIKLDPVKPMAEIKCLIKG